MREGSEPDRVAHPDHPSLTFTTSASIEGAPLPLSPPSPTFQQVTHLQSTLDNILIVLQGLDSTVTMLGAAVIAMAPDDKEEAVYAAVEQARLLQSVMDSMMVED